MRVQDHRTGTAQLRPGDRQPLQATELPTEGSSPPAAEFHDRPATPFGGRLRQAIEAAPRTSLDACAKAVWAALGAGSIGDEEADTLLRLVAARKAPAVAPAAPRRFVGSRPRTDASMERRRRWAASGRLPPGLACRFTLAEAAVLALVAAEVCRRGDCRMAVGHLAAIAGVSETTVRNALRQASKLGLLTVTERRLTGFRNDTNVVAIVSAEWTAWLKLGPKGGAMTASSPRQGGSRLDADRQATIGLGGGGCRFPQGTPTRSSSSGIMRPWKPK